MEGSALFLGEQRGLDLQELDPDTRRLRAFGQETLNCASWRIQALLLGLSSPCPEPHLDASGGHSLSGHRGQLLEGTTQCPAVSRPDGTPRSCKPCLGGQSKASAFIIAMLLASLNSCCNPWIYMLFTGHLFHELVQRFLCCSSSYLKGSRPGETSVSKKSNSSTFVLSRHSSSQRSSSQPSTV